MGKVRDRFTNDAEGLAQWMGRKIKNHNPMSARDGQISDTHERFVRDAYEVGIVAEDPTKIRYTLKDGRTFEFSCREVTAEEAVALVKVGS